MTNWTQWAKKAMRAIASEEAVSLVAYKVAKEVYETGRAPNAAMRVYVELLQDDELQETP